MQELLLLTQSYNVNNAVIRQIKHTWNNLKTQNIWWQHHDSVADKLMKLISNNVRWLLHNFEID